MSTHNCESCHDGEWNEPATVRVKGDKDYNRDHGYSDLCADHFAAYKSDGYKLTVVKVYQS